MRVWVHSHDAARHLWAPCVAAVRQFVHEAEDVLVLTEALANEDLTPAEVQAGVRLKPCGDGAFNVRLKKALEDVPAATRVLYAQDDFIFFRPVGATVLTAMHDAISSCSACFVRLLNTPEQTSAECGVVSVAPAPSPPPALAKVCQVVEYAPSSPFLFSHQATLWRADILRLCVGDASRPESAFENEVLGTRRLQRYVRETAGVGPMLGIHHDAYRTVVGHPGKPGVINAYGDALIPFARALAAQSQKGTRVDTNGLKALLRTATAAAGPPQTPPLDAKALAAVHSFDRQHALVMRIQAAARAGSREFACPLCRKPFKSMADFYGVDHACIDSDAVAFFRAVRGV